MTDLNIETPSLAKGQRSLGPGNPAFPLLPRPTLGCPETSNDGMQFPLEVDYDYSAVSRVNFAKGAGWHDWTEILPPLHPKMTMPVGNTPLVDVSAVAPPAFRGRGRIRQG
jgi:threonine synthase